MLYSYIQFFTHQCFCFPNSQLDTTAHYIPPALREDRKLDILENINYSFNETETCQGNAMSKYIHTKCSCCPVESIRGGSDAD